MHGEGGKGRNREKLELGEARNHPPIKLDVKESRAGGGSAQFQRRLRLPGPGAGAGPGPRDAPRFSSSPSPGFDELPRFWRGLWGASQSPRDSQHRAHSPPTCLLPLLQGDAAGSIAAHIPACTSWQATPNRATKPATRSGTDAFFRGINASVWIVKINALSCCPQNLQAAFFAL